VIPTATGRRESRPPYDEAIDGAVLDATIEEHEELIRPGVDLSWVRQLLFAPVMSAVLTHKARVTRAQLEFTLDTVLAGLAP